MSNNKQFTQNTYYHRKQQVQPERPHYIIRSIFVIGIAILGISYAISGVSHAYTHKKPLSAVMQHQSALKAQLSSLISKQSYRIGVAIDDTSTGDNLTVGMNQPFVAASTAKIITAAAYYHLVETGQATLSEQVGSWPAGFQLEEMVNDSDNDSWSDLDNAVTLPTLDAYAISLGITGYDANSNLITPSQMASVLSRLYTNKLLNHTDTKQLLSYMQNTNMEQMIPAVTPSNITVYHKYGLLNGALHDAAILTDGSRSYALVIYTQNSDDSDDLARISMIRRIAQIAITNLFPGSQPLNPAAPTEIDD